MPSAEPNRGSADGIDVDAHCFLPSTDTVPPTSMPVPPSWGLAQLQPRANKRAARAALLPAERAVSRAGRAGTTTPNLPPHDARLPAIKGHRDRSFVKRADRAGEPYHAFPASVGSVLISNLLRLRRCFVTRMRYFMIAVGIALLAIGVSSFATP